jgi:hypothetical protein
MCLRQSEGLSPCPSRWPQHPVHWCPECRTAYINVRFRELFELFEQSARREEAIAPSHVAGEEPEERPCPLEAHQVEDYQLWLSLGERPAWSLGQVSRPSPN